MIDTKVTIKVSPHIFNMLQTFKKCTPVDWDKTEIWESFINQNNNNDRLDIIYKLTEE